MNRYREDAEYRFYPPKYSRLLAPLIYWISDTMMLRRKNRVVGVKIAQGGEEVKRLYEAGNALLIAPNHSDHSDPHALMHLSRLYRIPIHFMAAKELFDPSKGIQGRLFQAAGVFSIDREGSDLQSIKTAMKILYDAAYPLVMFPEGEIYHLHEKLTPLNEGAATLALRAAKKIRKDKPGKSAYIIPAALRYSYVDDISSTFGARMSRLEQRVLWKPQTQLDIVARIYKFGEAVLALKEKEFLDRTLDGTLGERLVEFREILIRREEERYFGAVGDDTLPNRVRKLRGKIRSILVPDGDPPSKQERDQCYDSLDCIYFAVQLYSYPGQYLHEKPSMDRIAETLHKFEEDAFDENLVYGKKSVEITFCKPINLMEHLPAYAKDSKHTVASVTRSMADAIQGVVEG